VKRKVLLAAFALCIALNISAIDFGGMVNGQVTGQHDKEGADLSGGVVSTFWLAQPLGAAADFYFSAGLSASFAEEENVLAPDLHRLELVIRPFESASLRAGRFLWQDPSRFTARGRFDGMELSFDVKDATIGAAALFTNLLYRGSSNISASPADKKDYSKQFDWADFEETYFAPPHFLAALYGEFPGLYEGRGRMYAGYMAQFDLSGADEGLHTRYLFLRHILAYQAFDLSAAGAVQFHNPRTGGTRTAFAFSVETGLQLPGPVTDRFSFGLRWASGSGPRTTAYFPVTAEAQGVVFRPSLSGMMVLRANYEARLLPELSMELGGRYFVRMDTAGSAPPVTGDSLQVGGELNASLLWVPFSDISFSFGGGVFFPKTGKSMNDATVRWTLSTIVSF
jgi:hypothetical protein